VRKLLGPVVAGAPAALPADRPVESHRQSEGEAGDAATEYGRMF